MSMTKQLDSRKLDRDDDDHEVPLPGFRFHPTDAELVGFYLRRKVEKKPISLELIKQIDIYKYDPWNLPKAAGSTAKDTEWYFFCKRGRKYRNSIRPNRVTGSGFWKATGIDKQVYSTKGADRQGHHDCIGLKKTLVYYSGSAGKGTKTEWMMHEFRLPADIDTNTNHSNAKTTAPEAEIWTLCRIFERHVSHRKYAPVWGALSAKRHTAAANYSSSEACSLESNNREGYINFGSTPFVYYNNDHEHNEKKPVVNHHVDEIRNQLHVGQLNATAFQPPSSSGFPIDGPDENYALFDCGNWNDDELGSVVEFALNQSRM